MKLLYKQTSPETKKAMIRTIENQEFSNQKDIETKVEEKILSKTRHNYCKIVNSGNAGILTAMNAIEGPILIPDQGAWHGFKQIAKFLNKKIIIFKTDLGLINIEILEDILKENSLINNKYTNNDNDNNKNNNCKNVPGLFLTSFAGYTAEQPIEEISKWCKKNEILLIEDASGGITDPEMKLGNGNYSDIIIVSTSSPKIINIGDGGFITTNKKEIFEKSKLILKICKSNKITEKAIANEIEFAENNLKGIIEATTYIKNRLDNVIHENKRGINVVIQSDDNHNLAKNLKKEFDLNGRSFITKCPNYNRLKQKGLAIEIKNIDPRSLTKENLDNIINVVKKCQ